MMPRACRRPGCTGRGARRFEWRNSEGELVYAYFCASCTILAKGGRSSMLTLGTVPRPPSEPGDDSVISLADRRRGHRDVKPDKEPA